MCLRHANSEASPLYASTIARVLTLEPVCSICPSTGDNEDAWTTTEHPATAGILI